MKIFWPKLQTSEAVAWRNYVKEVFFKISENLHKNIITSNLINTGFKPLPSPYFHFYPATSLKKTWAQLFSCEFSEIFSITYYVEHSQTAASAFQ